MFEKLLLLAVRDVGWRGIVTFALSGLTFAVSMRAVTNVVAPGVAPYAFTYPAALIATLFGGWQSGLLALILSEGLGWLVVVPQAGLAGAPMHYQFSAAAIAALTGISVIAVAQAFRLAARFGFTERGEKLAEREMLFRELQHRVANDFTIVMALLKLEAKASEDRQAKLSLDRAAQRVNSFARIHRQIYLQPDIMSLNLKQYLDDLAAGLKSGAIPEHIDFSINVPPLLCGRDVGLALGLLLNELVTNAAKHAFPDGRRGEIAISIRRNSDGWTFAVKDDGVGSNNFGAGVGGGLVGQFAKQAGGQLIYKHDNGIEVNLLLPENALRVVVFPSEPA